MFSNVLTPENPSKFCCEKCHFITCNKKDYARHILTKKHKMMDSQGISMDFSQKTQHECSCGKIYKDHSGLWRHKKKCITPPQIVDASNNIITILLNQNMELIKQNQEFKDLLAEQNKNMFEIATKVGGNTMNSNNVTNNNNNTNNNHFNLQFFLNETCKDALNIDEFVSQIKLKISDLDMMGQLGYVAGMSNVIVRNLKELDVCKRPIHCSDLKREILYIKDKDVWEKDTSENTKIKKAIKGIECKNIKQITQWKADNPTYEDTETRKHMEYHHILIEALGGPPLEDDNKKQDKIIRNIAREVVIDKSNG